MELTTEMEFRYKDCTIFDICHTLYLCIHTLMFRRSVFHWWLDMLWFLFLYFS